MKKVVFILCFEIFFLESVKAATIVESGTCGTNCTYTIDLEGNLVASGPMATGQTGDFSGHWNQFSNREDITSIEIKGNISSVSGQPFTDMPNVTSIKIGDGVQSIGNRAFRGNSATAVYIGKVENMGEGVFQDMSNLETVTFADDSNPKMGAHIFSGASKVKNLILPEGLQQIGNHVFSNMHGLVNLVIPDSLTSIGLSAFFNAQYIAPEIIYCQDTPTRKCSDLIQNAGGYQNIKYATIKSYTKQDGMYVLKDGENKTYFASAVDMAEGIACQDTSTQAGINSCIAQALQNKKKCQSQIQCTKIVENASNGEFLEGGKFYASLDDFISGNYIKKRIYTVDEANLVSKPTRNRFKIRYK